MRFRPFTGYVIIVCFSAVFALFGAYLHYFHQLRIERPTLDNFIVGLTVGSLLGLLLGYKAFMQVEVLLVDEGQMSSKRCYDLFGFRLYRYLLGCGFVVWIIMGFLFPGSFTIFLAGPLGDGLLNGFLMFYFGYFAVRVLLKERHLKHKIVVTVA